MAEAASDICCEAIPDILESIRFILKDYFRPSTLFA